MNLLDAHERLAALSADERQELLPGEFVIDLPEGPIDCWPAFAAAAVVLAGALPTSDSIDDLRAGVGHFRSLLNIEVVTEEAWVSEAEQVIMQLMEWGERSELAAGVWN